ncbi:MAG TPA: hypothetical protein VFL47_03775, partial [Flavisolibacter sp.]|nr:hypothetical protein [Flavisolibacter sp.]
MKKKHNWYRRWCFLFLLLGIAAAGQAQKMRLNLYGSYVLDGTYQIYYKNGDLYNGTMHQGLQLGLGTEYLLSSNFGVE